MKGYYTGPNTQLGSLVANNLMALLCIDFMKISPLRYTTEDVLILTDVFLKLSQAFVTTNQEVITIAKILVDKCCMCMAHEHEYIEIKAEISKWHHETFICIV